MPPPTRKRQQQRVMAVFFEMATEETNLNMHARTFSLSSSLSAHSCGSHVEWLMSTSLLRNPDKVLWPSHCSFPPTERRLSSRETAPTGFVGGFVLLLCPPLFLHRISLFYSWSNESLSSPHFIVSSEVRLDLESTR